jgi:hypothetical protein
MDRKAFIKSCRRKGYKYVDTAKFLGVSRQRVEQLLRPIKNEARYEVHRAGFKSKPCEYPGCKKTKTEAHHFDYSKPLDIHWLCIKHHKEFHSKEKLEIKKTKKCARCLKELEKDQIKWCLDCKAEKARQKSRLAYKNNPTRRENQKRLNYEWRKNNPEQWKKINDKSVKRYKKLHKDKIRKWANVYNKKVYHSNIEFYRAKQREYYKKNIEKKRQNAREKYRRKKIMDLST